MTSFLDLLEVHRDLDELFLRHQEALLERDLPRAMGWLARHREAVVRHAHDEERELLPLYASVPRERRQAASVFVQEHQRLHEMLDRIETLLLSSADRPLEARTILHLLEREASYKHLFEHHDQRERSQLFPALDELVPEGQRAAILSRLLFRPLRGPERTS